MGDAHHCSGPPVSEMTYTVSSGTLNPSIPCLLSDKLSETIASYIPVKKSDIKKTCLWLNKKVKKAIKKRNKIWKRYRCTKSDQIMRGIKQVVIK